MYVQESKNWKQGSSDESGVDGFFLATTLQSTLACVS